MNKSLLHKETGDKESARRGKYLNRLLHQAALGPNRPMQLNIGVGERRENPDAYDKAAAFQQSPIHPYDYSQHNSLAEQNNQEGMYLKGSQYRTSSVPEVESGKGIPGTQMALTNASNASHSKVFAIPRIDLTKSFKQYRNPLSNHSTDIPSAQFTQTKDNPMMSADHPAIAEHQTNNYDLVVNHSGKNQFSLISAGQGKRQRAMLIDVHQHESDPQMASKMMNLKKLNLTQGQLLDQSVGRENLPNLHVHTSAFIKAQQELLQSYSPKRHANTRIKAEREKGFFKLNENSKLEEKAARAIDKILGKNTQDRVQVESERYKRRQRSPQNLGQYLNEEKLAANETLAQNLFRKRQQRVRANNMLHQSVDMANTASAGYEYGLAQAMENQIPVSHKTNNILNMSVQVTNVSKEMDSFYSTGQHQATGLASVPQGMAHDSILTMTNNPNVMSPIRVSQRDQAALFSAGGQSRRARLNQFGSYYDEFGREIMPNELNDLPQIAKYTKNDVAQDTKKDIIKFYCVDPGAANVVFNEDAFPKKNLQSLHFVTTSNHYKYNRIREGGWGKKLPETSKMKSFVMQSGSKFYHGHSGTQFTSQKHSRFGRNMRMNSTAATPNISPFDDEFSAFGQRKDMMQYQRAMRALNEQQRQRQPSEQKLVISTNFSQHQHQQIFQSVDDRQIEAAREKNKTMLQDSLMEPSYQDNATLRKNDAEASPATSQREYDRSRLATTKADALAQSSERPKEIDTLLGQSQLARRQTQEINRLNQYNSQTRHDHFGVDYKKKMDKSKNSTINSSPRKQLTASNMSSQPGPPHQDVLVSKSFNIRDLGKNDKNHVPGITNSQAQFQTTNIAEQQQSLKTSNYQSTAMNDKERETPDLMLTQKSHQKIMQEIAAPQIQLHSKEGIRMITAENNSLINGWDGSTGNEKSTINKEGVRVGSAEVSHGNNATAINMPDVPGQTARSGSRNIVFQQFDQNKDEGTKNALSAHVSSTDAASAEKKSREMVARSPQGKIVFENVAIGKQQFKPGVKKKMSRNRTSQRSRPLDSSAPSTVHDQYTNPNRLKAFNFEDMQPIQQMEFQIERRTTVRTASVDESQDQNLRNKLKDLKTLRHLQQLRKQSIDQQRTIEREERKSIFEVLSDHKTNKLIAGYAHQGLQEQREINRKLRQIIMDKMQAAESLIKERKREIERQKQKNVEVQMAFEHQMVLLAKLNRMELNTSVNRDGVTSLNSSGLAEYEMAQRRNDDGLNASFDQSMLPTDPHAATTSMADASSNQHARGPQHASMGASDIKGLYKHLFENDLRWTKNRAMDELNQVQDRNYYCSQEAEYLRKVQDSLKGNIKRYQRMIKELKESDGPLDFSNTLGRKSIRIEKNMDELLKTGHIVLSKAEKAKLADDQLKQEMDEKLFRQSKREQSPPLLSNQDNGSASPNTGFKRRQATIRSTPASNKLSSKIGNVLGLTKHLAFDMKKLEMITSMMPLIHRQRKPLDQIVMLLTLTQKVFKAQRVTFFLTDPDFASKYLSYGDRKHNYKKIMMESTAVYAIFAQVSHFHAPLFFDPKEVQPIFNNRQILMPIMDPNSPRSVQMVLQIIHDDKATSSMSKPNKGEDVSERGASVAQNASRKSPQKARQASVAQVAGASSSRSQEDDGNSVMSGSQVMGRRKAAVAVAGGFNQSDRVVAKIMSELMQMSTQYFFFQVLKKQKKAKIDDVIEFAMDTFDVRTYRQIIHQFKKNVDKLIGFESCTVFFDNQTTGDLFTLTTQDDDPVEVEMRLQKKLKDPNYIDISFAKELIFPENEVIIFPRAMGISGEVHQKMGLKYENNFGQTVGEAKIVKSDDDDFELRSDASSHYPGAKGSVISGGSYKLAIQKSQPAAQLKGKNALSGFPNTKLEQIKEDAQQAEEEQVQAPKVRADDAGSPANSQIDLRPQKSAQTQLDENGNIVMDNQVDEMGKTHTVNFNESILKKKSVQEDIDPYIHGSEHSIGEEANPNTLAEKRKSSQTNYQKASTEPFSPGKIDNVQYGSYQLQQKQMMSMTQRRKVKDNYNKLFDGIMAGTLQNSLDDTIISDLQQGEKYYSSFIPDIDNFEGVKHIRNYCIASVRENGYGFGDKSIGVVQVFNKTDGRPVDTDAIKRIQYFTRFVGALSAKAQAVTGSLTLILGLMQTLRFFNTDIHSIDSTEGLGSFNTIMLQMDIIWKQTTDHQKIKEEDHKFLIETLAALQPPPASRSDFNEENEVKKGKEPRSPTPIDKKEKKK